MLTTRFGIEIEFTGITRRKAAEVIAEHFTSSVLEVGTYYDAKEIRQADGRIWKVMSNGSINCQRKQSGTKVQASREYSVEVVSPILSYESDIDNLQEIVRKLRKAGGFANHSCGIHIHLDGAKYTVRTIRNFLNIIASQNDFSKVTDWFMEMYRTYGIRPLWVGYGPWNSTYWVQEMDDLRFTMERCVKVYLLYQNQ